MCVCFAIKIGSHNARYIFCPSNGRFVLDMGLSSAAVLGSKENSGMPLKLKRLE